VLKSTLSIVLVLGACAAPPSQPAINTAANTTASTMTGDQIRQSVIGKTLASTTHRGTPYTMTLMPDGTGTGVFAGAATEKLTWEIKDDVLCFHGNINSNECDRVSPIAGGVNFVDAKTGALSNKYTYQLKLSLREF
jgi:hypothetical protein